MQKKLTALCKKDLPIYGLKAGKSYEVRYDDENLDNFEIIYDYVGFAYRHIYMNQERFREHFNI